MKTQSSDHYTMSPFELSITHISFTIGAGILTLPRALVSSLESSFGWVSILFCGLIMAIFVSLIVKLQRRLTKETIFDYFSRSHHLKWLGKLFSVLFFLYFLAFFAIEGRILANVVHIYLLDQTPSEVIFLIMLLATTYACSKGVEGIVHISLIYFPFVLLVLGIVVLMNVGNLNINELRPFVATEVIRAFDARNLIYFFLGFEIFFFWLKYVNPIEPTGKKQKKHKPLVTYLLGVVGIVILYALVVVFSFGVLTVEATKILPFPTIELSKEVEVLEGLIERLEPLVIVMWIMTIFNTMAILQFIASNTFHAQWFKKGNANIVAFTFGLLSFFIAFSPDSIPESLQMSDWIGYGGFSVTILLLIVGFIVVKKSNKTKSGAAIEQQPGREMDG
ncbi:GerAB/ArcD/ProY family transporter [Alteribacter aurantiacus]|uniref:GerAB/ArcD/ProY family transporter n=1 Tax=Alteribacter aurantiacus TaxID=254410 RepID=UPI0004020B75|nr:GerAB/ArcD/ProY family transporter [Alteribacter aurantiacus]